MASDAGLVQIVYGSPTGLLGGKGVREHKQGAGYSLGGADEAGDWTGYALAAGRTAGGTSYLLIGTPGEDIDAAVDTGAFFYVANDAATAQGNHQDTETAGAVDGANETDDRFGASLAATPTHFAVGRPGEALGAVTFAGGVGVFSHTLVSGHPKPIAGLGQDLDVVDGAPEVGDGFGTAVAMVPYRASGATSTTEALLAIGSPGEDLKTVIDAGAVQVFKIAPGGSFVETEWIEQDSLEVEEKSEAGDFFGQRLAAANTVPNSTSSGTNTRLAIGAPGEESAEEHREKGGFHMVPMVGDPGVSDAWFEPGMGIPGEPAPIQLAGLSLAPAPGGLYVGMPYGPVAGHAVHLFPWNAANGGAPTQTFKPGEGGIPTGDTSFGAAVR
ncbi:VCBS repeat-containing protein [Streptomyces sp. NPDC002867]